MKKQQNKAPLTGEAKFLASKAEIAKRNEEARDRLMAERAVPNARRAARRLAEEKAEASNLPKQPRPQAG